MPFGLQIFEAARVNRVMAALQDIRELPQQLRFLARTPVVPATDGEIMARFVGRVQIADIIADDQEAVTYSALKINLETTNVPNLKHGAHLTQEALNQLAAINARGTIENDPDGIFSNYENRLVDGLLLGIRQRMEALIISMMVDGLSYNRLGIIMNNVTWGMPSDLKITTSTAWTDPVNSTPVSDILATKRVGMVRYGIMFDRMTLSYTALNYMTATTEFQNRARIFLPPSVSTAALPLQDVEFQRNLATNILGMKEIEIYDARYWQQGTNGQLASYPFLPINQVILTSTENDNDPAAFDFANGIATETIVSSMLPTGMVGQFRNAQRGPVAYVTGPPDLNPPNITYWGVARGFPRKHLLQSSAVLTVGSFTDTIAVGVPF